MTYVAYAWAECIDVAVIQYPHFASIHEPIYALRAAVSVIRVYLVDPIMVFTTRLVEGLR